MFSVVIVAAGSAKRAGLGYNKIFYKIKDKTLLEYSVQPFLEDEEIAEIIIVVSKEDLQKVRSLFSSRKVKFVIGGSSRQKSVFNGLSLIKEDYVLIHDSARPNLALEDLTKIKASVIQCQAAVIYSPAKDSVVKYTGDKIESYLDRNVIGLVQTPQAFQSEAIKKAHSNALKSKREYTDDASLYMMELDREVMLIKGRDSNIKATTKTDLILLEELL